MKKNVILAIAAECAPRAIELRRAIHMHPELSDEEYETSALIQGELSRLGIQYETFEDSTAVVGIIRGAKDGDTVGLRADMDALPIQENTGLPFASKVAGVMHACGHDAHTAVLLGTAAALCKVKDKLRGNVKLFFQPAEEGDGGAKKMVERGCMKNPDVKYVFGLHCSGGLDVGKIGCAKGMINANSNTVDIEVIGQKSHGAHPVNGIDAIFVGAQVVTALHGMTSRRISAFDPVELNVGMFHAGEAHNITCDSAKMRVMLRTRSIETRERLKAEIRRLVEGICAANGASCNINIIDGYEVSPNDPECVDIVERVANELLGENGFTESEGKSMGTEDFCYFSREAKGAFYSLGTGLGNPPGHSSEFCINDSAIETGIAMQTGIVMSLIGE